MSKSRYNVDLILVVYYISAGQTSLLQVSALLKISSFSTCNYADQTKPLIQRTPTGCLLQKSKIEALTQYRINITIRDRVGSGIFICAFQHSISFVGCLEMILGRSAALVLRGIVLVQSLISRKRYIF